MNTFDVNDFQVENNKYLFEHFFDFPLTTPPFRPEKTFSQSRHDRAQGVWSENSLIDESVGDFK